MTSPISGVVAVFYPENSIKQLYEDESTFQEVASYLYLQNNI
jgi:hypothetical protein